MSHWSRLAYAFFLAVVLVGILMVLDMLLRLDIGRFIFCVVFFIPALCVGYLVAPYVARHIPRR
jgi:hypothetical protein